jgi:hypothetical protein
MEKSELIEFLKDNAKIEFTAEGEHIPVRGNALDSGDDAEDKKAEDYIIEQLNKGNLSNWFSAKISATYDNFHGVDYLGCCSYASFEEFQKDAYYTSMVEQAIEDLAGQILSRKYDLDKIERLVENNSI